MEKNTNSIFSDLLTGGLHPLLSSNGIVSGQS